MKITNITYPVTRFIETTTVETSYGDAAHLFYARWDDNPEKVMSIILSTEEIEAFKNIEEITSPRDFIPKGNQIKIFCEPNFKEEYKAAAEFNSYIANLVLKEFEWGEEVPHDSILCLFDQKANIIRNEDGSLIHTRLLGTFSEKTNDLVALDKVIQETPGFEWASEPYQIEGMGKARNVYLELTEEEFEEILEAAESGTSRFFFATRMKEIDTCVLKVNIPGLSDDG